MNPIPKNRQIRPRARQSFYFQKITGTLKRFFFLKICKYLLLLKETIVNTQKILIGGGQNGKIGF